MEMDEGLPLADRLNAQERAQYLALLDRIYPGPRAAVEQAWGGPELAFSHFYSQPGNQGVVCLLRAPDHHFSVGYLAFDQDAPLPVLERLRADLQPLLPTGFHQELCFNLYGRNPQAIQWVQSLGFQLEMSGFKYQYAGGEQPVVQHGDLCRKAYRPEDLGQYADLLDSSYAWLQRQSGMHVNSWAADPEALGRLLEQADGSGNLLAFWLEERLAGLCLTRADGYIENLAVHPDFQERGIGREILWEAIAELQTRGVARIHLDVAAVNVRAQRFYESCGFIECGCFADHTYFR